MKKRIVPTINHLNQLDELASELIENEPWKKVNNKPIVQFKMAHDGANIFIKYLVQEQNMVAKTLADNGRVWEDSCVEFFFSPENDGFYYNFECNCIGAKLLAVGNSRHNRTFASALILDKITVISTLEKKVFKEKTGVFNWSITAIIPINSFFKHALKTLNNKTFKANFYKCGDGLKTPHFLAWQNIETAEPDFHTPQYFGDILFE
jgi:hypothetical protein